MAAAMDQVDDAPTARTSAGRWLLAAGAAALLIVLVLPIDQAAGIVRPSDHFRPAGSLMSAPMAVGETMLVGILRSEERVQVDAVEPVIVQGSATASVELFACRQVQARIALGGADGSELGRYCEDVAPAEGSTIGGGSEKGTYVVAVIHPLEAGTVTIDGVRITHSRGPFHRTEHTGLNVEVRVS